MNRRTLLQRLVIGAAAVLGAGSVKVTEAAGAAPTGMPNYSVVAGLPAQLTLLDGDRLSYIGTDGLWHEIYLSERYKITRIGKMYRNWLGGWANLNWGFAPRGNDDKPWQLEELAAIARADEWMMGAGNLAGQDELAAALRRDIPTGRVLGDMLSAGSLDGRLMLYSRTDPLPGTAREYNAAPGIYSRTPGLYISDVSNVTIRDGRVVPPTFEAMAADCAGRGCRLESEYNVYQLATRIEHWRPGLPSYMKPDHIWIDRVAAIDGDDQIDSWRRSLHEPGHAYGEHVTLRRLGQAQPVGPFITSVKHNGGVMCRTGACECPLT